MFGEFVKVTLPVALVGLLMIAMVPDLFKLIPIIFIGGTIWSSFQVAQGFAEGDVRRENEDW